MNGFVILIILVAIYCLMGVLLTKFGLKGLQCDRSFSRQTAFAGEEGDSSAEIRETIRNLAFDKWMEHPLFGYGFDSFKYLADKVVGHFYYSHCNYTELLYSGGIVYFLLFYWIYYKILRNAFCNKKIPVEYKAFSVATAVSLFVFDYGAVTYNSTSTLIMLMMAYTASNFARGATETNEQTANTDTASEK